MKISHLPLRLAAVAFIVNSGLSKLDAPDEVAQGVHGFATAAYPELKRLPPEKFVRLLSAGELAIGAALLTPFVPTAVAGAALTAFSAGLVGLYVKVPGMRQGDSLKPTEEGTAIAKTSGSSGSASRSSSTG